MSVAITVGVGKTHIAQALGHAACRRGYTCVFTKTSRLLADLARATPTAPGPPACGAGPAPTC